MLMGLTGGIACGKSTVADMLAQHGFEILDTDDVAHQCLERAGDCYEDVVDTFGEQILDDAGTIDRQILGRIVFQDPAQRKTLEKIMHPVIGATWHTWGQNVRDRDVQGCVVIPLLFEGGAVEGWDAIVCISAAPETVMARLTARGLTREEACLRIESQLPLPEKERQSNYVIENNGSLSELETNVRNLINELVSSRR